MPDFGQNFRTQILIGLKADGLGEADKLAQEMLRVKRAIDAVREEFNQGALAADLYRKLLRPLIGDLNFLVKEYDAVVGAQDKLEASGARAAAAFAKQEAAAEKAAMAHAGLAQKATLAVQAASDRINALLGKEVAEQLAAAERKAAIDAQAGARHEADLQQIHQAHLAFLAKEEAAEQASNARHEAELQGMHQRHLAFLAKEESAEAAAAQRKADVESRAGATYEAELERMHQSHLAFLAREEAAEAAANARHEAELQQMHQSHQQFLAADAAAEEAAGARHEAEMADLASKHVAFLGQEEATEAAAASRHEAELQRMHQAHLEFFAKEAAAEAQANARHDAEMGQAHQKHLEFLAKEQAAEQVAIDALRRQKDEALAGFAKMNEAIRRIEEQERKFFGQNIRAYAGINREQEHLNDLLVEGLQYESSTVTLVDKTAKAYRAKSFEVERSVDGLTRFTQVTDATARASKGGASAMDEGTKSTKQFGLGILNISHAIQDAQYGFGAVVNNIALVTQSLGGGPGLAGTAMVVGVAVSVLSNNIKGLAQSVGALEDPTMRAAVTIADLKEKIKDVEEKPHKLEIDYQAIEAARKEVDALEKKLSAFKAIGEQTTTQEKVGKAVSETIKEHAGGTDELSGKENLEKLMIAAAGPQFQEEAIRTSKSKKAEQIREAQSRLEALRAMKPEDLMEAQAIGIQINDTIESIARLRHDLTGIVKEKVDSVIGGAARGIDADRARIAELFDRNEKLFTEGDKARGILPVGPMFRGALEVASAANVRDRKRFEEQAKRDADMAKEQLKQQKEREDLDDKLTAMGKQADDALIAQHAAAFGAKKALGGLIEAKTRELVGKGEKDPERLRAAARAIAEADIRESKFVPEEIVPAVAVKVAEPHTEKAVAELIAGAAPGQDIVATAKAGAAAGEAKAKAKAEKAEKPEITHEAARIGREIGADVHDAILRRAAKKESDEKIRGGLAGQVGRVVAEGGVDPDIMADVAAKIIGDELGKVRAEQAAKGGVNPQTARAILGERQVKAAGQEQARERGVERVQGAAARPAVARQIFAEFGGNVSPEQATVGAEKYQQLLSRGENPMIAAQKVMADMFGVLQENLNTMGAMTGMFEQVQGMVAMARQRQQAIESVVARLEGKLKSQRWVKPPPWGTIGGG